MAEEIDALRARVRELELLTQVTTAVIRSQAEELDDLRPRVVEEVHVVLVRGRSWVYVGSTFQGAMDMMRREAGVLFESEYGYDRTLADLCMEKLAGLANITTAPLHWDTDDTWETGWPGEHEPLLTYNRAVLNIGPMATPEGLNIEDVATPEGLRVETEATPEVTHNPTP